MQFMRNKQGRAFIAAAALIASWFVHSPVLAGTTVYKCVINGQTTLTDKPCPGDKPNDPSQSSTVVVPSNTEPSPVGKWSGQLQFQETANSQVVQAAHSVAETRVEFTADGKVSGASPDNACTILGVWSEGSSKTLIWIDITLDRCVVEDLNRRYHGSFILARPDRSGQVSIQSIGAGFSKDVGKYFDLKGTLRRQPS